MKRNITESDILKACIVLSIIGLGIINISQSFITPDKVEIGRIDETWIGNSVKISGEISSVSSSNQTVFLDVRDSSGDVTVVNFDGGNYTEGSNIEATGYVDLYEGETEIIADKIKLK